MQKEFTDSTPEAIAAKAVEERDEKAVLAAKVGE